MKEPFVSLLLKQDRGFEESLRKLGSPFFRHVMGPPVRFPVQICEKTRYIEGSAIPHDSISEILHVDITLIVDWSTGLLLVSDYREI